MTVVVKSSPDTPEAKRGVQMAIDMGADIVLLQNGVYSVLLESAPIPDIQIYALEDDCLMRGIVAHPGNRVRMIDYADLVDILQQSDHVIGMM